jgi:hypothetical protein
MVLNKGAWEDLEMKSKMKKQMMKFGISLAFMLLKKTILNKRRILK